MQLEMKQPMRWTMLYSIMHLHFKHWISLGGEQSLFTCRRDLKVLMVSAPIKEGRKTLQATAELDGIKKGFNTMPLSLSSTSHPVKPSWKNFRGTA
jgi:hypothetical protein